MKVIKVKPDSDHLEGYADLKVPPYHERIALMQETRAKPGKKDGEDDDNLEVAKKIIDVVKSHVQTVDIKASDGEKCTSIDDVSYYEDGVAFINKLSGVLMKGVSLSDVEKKP